MLASSSIWPFTETVRSFTPVGSIAAAGLVGAKAHKVLARSAAINVDGIAEIERR
jgi:hypothetical protein